MLSRLQRISRQLAPGRQFNPQIASMSSFMLPNSQPEVQVNLTSDLSKDQLLAFPAFKNWISTLQHSLSLQQEKSHTFSAVPYALRKIDIQAVDFFGGNRLGFVKLKAEVSNDNGESLPGSIFLRGGSVGMMAGFWPIRPCVGTLSNIIIAHTTTR